MGRIVAIGGGSYQSTKRINEYMIGLAHKERPNVLFIGTASRDAEGNIANAQAAFGAFGCDVKALRLVTKHPTESEIAALADWADIVYVGGGNTVFMMEVWKACGLDRMLRAAYENDTAVLGGLSAGAICWFDCGHSDSESFAGNADWHYIFAEGMLGLQKFVYCPHYNEAGRDSFDEMLKVKTLPGLALENETAFAEDNGKISFIRSRPDAKAYRIVWQDGRMTKSKIVFDD